ncbi:MAG TPA: ectonucleotide pyrophosphatase/phosphodiesterase [Gemmatimonadales bacterium]|nr:ectonucleotide pyrophosphatase/phosphodiesterase [Gemmatimonadales bacterium]
MKQAVVVDCGRKVLLLLGLLIACAPKHAPGRSADEASGQAVLLVGLDGFHPSYLDRAASRYLRRLADSGVRARWMVPVLPTLTFPNFYSIVTGLYPEHHGIVSNWMKDTSLGERFRIGDSSAVHDPRWWGGEPLWVTAVRQGRKAASFFWPGSDVAIQNLRPTYYRSYDSSVPNAERVRQVIEWLSLPEAAAPDFVTIYFSDVDQAGHDFGPHSVETDSAIARVDSAVAALVRGLEARGLAQRVNLILVSDHGMSTLDQQRIIYLEDLIDLQGVDVIDWGPFLSLDPGRRQWEIYRQLEQSHPRLTVYHKSSIPAHYHYRSHHRIPPIIGIADDGWMVTTRDRLAADSTKPFSRGGHGHAPENESMRAIFVARGPAFRKGLVVEPFRNIHVYPLLAHILELQPAPHDGSLDSVRGMLGAPKRSGPLSVLDATREGHSTTSTD